ncbi:MAG TPA: polysaccharide biosynthesis/export family protein [Lacipirellulaceae bacterium]|jgi:protein involved in polysaccharide export with SLBB domain|nr:polysaccharide biosynthesis/export family protein [Lacipirellulaceae bacterium]
MTLPRQFDAIRAMVVALVAISSLSGCSGFLEPREPYPITPPEPSPMSTVPRELDKVSLPRYVIEPPDILMINAYKVVPRPPHRLEPFDGILIRVANAFSDAPIADLYYVDPEGKIDLGPTYGRVSVAGLTTDEAQDTIRRHLSNILDDPLVTVSLAISSGVQTIQGEHLVGPDGYVNLGTYGSVHVAGLTIDEATEQIERLLANELEDPEVVVDVFAYNSKKYYVVTQGAGLGDNVSEAPITGNETVLDAIARVGGISRVSSKNIWIARPAPNGVGCEQVLPVNWDEISRGASTATNYQLMPGDRLYIAEDAIYRFDTLIAKYTTPFERLFGIVSLGTGTFHRITRFGLANF